MIRFNNETLEGEKDILKLVTTIIVNTKGEGEKAVSYTHLINKFMKERPIFYKNLIQMKENFRFYLRCFYCITTVSYTHL